MVKNPKAKTITQTKVRETQDVFWLTYDMTKSVSHVCLKTDIPSKSSSF